MLKRKKILVAPLDWGLGHATRCVPVICRLLNEGHDVILAASGNSMAFLKLNFPGLEMLTSENYGIRYSKKIPMAWMMFIQSPKIIFRIWAEHRWLKKIIQENKIDEVISDNRYGLWNQNIHCVFITHQIMVKCPPGLRFMEGPLHRIIHWFISRYQECWIPDFSGKENLSGDLSHHYPLPASSKFIGLLSRFQPMQSSSNDTEKYDICVLLSGPDPQREILEKKLTKDLKESNLQAILIQGKPGYPFSSNPRKGFRVVSHLADGELESVLRSSKLIVCRSGYSSIMDLTTLGKKAILVPTPGQTEQEYLADYLSMKGKFTKATQDQISLKRIIQEISRN